MRGTRHLVSNLRGYMTVANSGALSSVQNVAPRCWHADAKRPLENLSELMYIPPQDALIRVLTIDRPVCLRVWT